MPLRFKTKYEPVETDFHNVKCHWTDKMLMSLYEPLNRNSRYEPAETKVRIRFYHYYYYSSSILLLLSLLLLLLLLL